MDLELDARLIRCFASIFDGLTADQIRTISVETQPNWDSLASVTLAAVLEEEFNIQVDPFDMPQLASFSAVKVYITSKLDSSLRG